jgi:hypothetical protein
MSSARSGSVEAGVQLRGTGSRREDDGIGRMQLRKPVGHRQARLKSRFRAPVETPTEKQPATMAHVQRSN